MGLGVALHLRPPPAPASARSSRVPPNRSCSPSVLAPRYAPLPSSSIISRNQSTVRYGRFGHCALLAPGLRPLKTGRKSTIKLASHRWNQDFSSSSFRFGRPAETGQGRNDFDEYSIGCHNKQYP
ncbi:hypothetical protein M407DRAFT_241691 [Tulasnella calospora MUT 4182]|uniref:Uncharacterized protein n=1 Tax=Tulasnella calospora MUT 4182 TaxID=1051891 RepID=A0A0C3QTZ1_9AGAM|nr:hypothetical protein M407DRAFT_241691 [Tulasnella calospora MUT 4182]